MKPRPYDNPPGYCSLVEYILLNGYEMPDPETLEAMEQRAMELTQERGVPVYTRPLLDPNLDVDREE